MVSSSSDMPRTDGAVQIGDNNIDLSKSVTTRGVTAKATLIDDPDTEFLECLLRGEGEAQQPDSPRTPELPDVEMQDVEGEVGVMMRAADLVVTFDRNIEIGQQKGNLTYIIQRDIRETVARLNLGYLFISVPTFVGRS